jgi:hypothetical protein
MENWLNSKYCHNITSIKLTSRDDTSEWYGILVSHDEMRGVFIPPWGSISPGFIAGCYWSKKLLGKTTHGQRRTMETHVHNLLLADALFSKDCEDEYRDIVNASSANGYASLHNIMWLYHQCITEKKAETKILTQGVSMRFGHHFRAIQEYLFCEATRGRTYIKYEALQLMLDTLYPKFHLDFNIHSEKESGQGHKFEDTIPFKLQMYQLGTTLSLWAKEM